ncbi:unnamed protein product [Symbiodinium pilosum]|uniref:Uncharacterized protein n=1 Tax=Symbiodinium pilosum TaxID=2952 RepID=A0A812LMY9_SYMPI|nr:unnamed protein product [Symbiodinium pilosum]
MSRWASHASRWARCRNAHLSSFARQVNLGLQGHRGLASCPALSRVCAEMRPAQGFVEQRTRTPGRSVSARVQILYSQRLHFSE